METLIEKQNQRIIVLLESIDKRLETLCWFKEHTLR